MAAALLGFGRIRGIHRPAIAVPLPLFGADRAQLLVDGGATVDPQPEWLVEWAVLGREYARVRLGVEEPSIALLSNGEEPGKGDALRKAAYSLLSEVKCWAGNVEGRDLVRASADGSSPTGSRATSRSRPSRRALWSWRDGVRVLDEAVGVGRRR
jgi:glycerol-3-phosphate acyltransferase PlsX